MRVKSTLPRSGLGLTLFALLASGALAQGKRGQALGEADRQKVVSSDEISKSVIRPTHFDWSELRQIQQSLPPNAFPMQEVLKALAQQPRSSEGVGVAEVEVDAAMLELSRRDHVFATEFDTEGPGGIENLFPCVGFGAAPGASLSTAGQGDGPDGFATMFYPPNPAGSVGPNHLMVMAPNITLIQDRLGASLGSVDTITFWSPTGAPSVTHCRLYYDLVAERWLASALGGSGVGTTDILFAISDTDDPTGGWDYYFWDADPAFLTFADHPKMGFGANHVVITADMFDGTAAPANTRGTRVYILDKPALLAATPVTLSMTGNDFWACASGVFCGSFVNWRLQPSRALDASDPDVYVWNSRATSGANILFQVGIIGGPGAAPTVAFPFGAGLYIPDYNYTNQRIAMLQLAPEARGIDPLPPDGQNASNRARFHDSVVRNGHNYLVNCTGQPGTNSIVADRNNVNFYEVDVSASPLLTPFVQAVPITTGAGTSLAFPSIAVNCANDVLIGMTSADSTKYLEAATAMRLGTDPLDTMGPVTMLKAGVDNWWQDAPAPQGNAITFGIPGLGAWGHYSTSSVDPNDGATLWTIQPYAETRVGGADADSRWGTWWGRFGDCEIRPVITDHPDPLNSCIGDPFSFTVSATTGSNPLTYQWRLDGMDILGANSPTYSVVSAVASDEGMYDVVIRGCGEEISLPAVLEFDEPTITTQPEDYTAELGDVAAFFVVATPSIGSLSYQWFHRGNPVGTNDDILVVGPVGGSDYGDYHVIVQDGCGTVLSSTVNLLPPVFGNKKQEAPSIEPYVQPQVAIGCVGESISFRVIDVPDGSSYEWRKDGVALVPPQTGPSMTLSGLTNADSGVYDCLVDTGSEIRESDGGVLAMADNPVVTNQPDDATASSSTTVTFSVTATGQGPLKYQWRFRPNEQGAPFTNIVGENGPTLLRVDVNSSSGGSYRCAISNQCGVTLSAIARLTIL